MKSSTIAGGSGKEERRAFDFYSTPKEATIALIEFLHRLGAERFNLSTGATAYEPACGEGAISEVLKIKGYKVISSDIRNTGYEDFVLDYAKEDRTPESYDILITNPPFNLAEEFIRKAAKKKTWMAFLLKAHFWHAKKRFDLWSSHTPDYVLPLTWRPDWTNGGSGSSPTMDFQWSVWSPDLPNNTCVYQPLLKPYMMLDELAKKINTIGSR